MTPERLHAVNARMHPKSESVLAGRPRPSAMPGSSKEPLQIRIPTEVKRRFKARAAMRGIEPNELFMEMWEFYQAGHDDIGAAG